tara:strand:- start:134 stop:538 length:405 start_codon:yes stop_codon:yes gene_type:complete
MNNCINNAFENLNNNIITIIKNKIYKSKWSNLKKKVLIRIKVLHYNIIKHLSFKYTLPDNIYRTQEYKTYCLNNSSPLIPKKIKYIKNEIVSELTPTYTLQIIDKNKLIFIKYYKGGCILYDNNIIRHSILFNY